MAGFVFICFYVFGVHSVLFLVCGCQWSIPIPVQSIAWRDSSLKWLIVCWLGC